MLGDDSTTLQGTLAVLEELAESRELRLTTYIRDGLEAHVRRRR